MIALIPLNFSDILTGSIIINAIKRAEDFHRQLAPLRAAT